MALAGSQDGARQPSQPPASPDSGLEFRHAVALHRQGKLAEAVRAYARVLEADPRHAEALNNLGVVLRAQGKLAAAVAAYRRGLALKPDDPGMLANLGAVLRSQGDSKQALAVLHRAVALAPKAPAVHHNLGLVLRDFGHSRDALACFERSLAIWPNNVAAKLDRAYTLLAAGDFAAGFKALEARFESDRRPVLVPGLGLWNGAPLGEQTLLVRAEGSLEDMLQFCRFLPAVKQRNGSSSARLVLECPRSLVRLLQGLSGVDEVAAFDSCTSAPSLQSPLLSLPRILGFAPQGLPGPIPYLTAPADAGFALPRPKGARLALGIVWAEQPEGIGQGAKGPGLAPFFDLMQRPDVAVFALQRGAAGGDLDRIGGRGMLQDLGARLPDLADLARLIEQLDLVVTSDPATAQLAGALGRPVWLALPQVADWRWALADDTTPWYPSMGLFRQPAPGDWSAVFAEIAGALDSLVGT